MQELHFLKPCLRRMVGDTTWFVMLLLDILHPQNAFQIVMDEVVSSNKCPQRVYDIIRWDKAVIHQAEEINLSNLRNFPHQICTRILPEQISWNPFWYSMRLFCCSTAESLWMQGSQTSARTRLPRTAYLRSISFVNLLMNEKDVLAPVNRLIKELGTDKELVISHLDFNSLFSSSNQTLLQWSRLPTTL